jgi:DNA-binding Lrp family transcriptional regulator
MPKISRKQNEINKQRVIDEVLRNPSLDTESLSHHTGLSKQQIWKILHLLENEGFICGTTFVLDPNKLGKRRYMILADRNNNPSDEEFLRFIVNDGMKFILIEKKIHVIIEDSYYLGGLNKWITIIMADNIVDASKFCETWRASMWRYFSKIDMAEITFTLRRNVVIKPDEKELRELLL